MDASTAVALTAALLATIVAVFVPWFTFRFAMQQDRVRWIREQRSGLYADMLAEANAEKEWLEFAVAGKETQDRLRELGGFTDKRLPPVERARLGAKGTIFGSQAVNQLFNELGAEAHRLLLTQDDPDAIQMMVRVKLGWAMDKLEQAVRRELGTDRVPLDGPGPAAPPGRNPTARAEKAPPAPGAGGSSDHG
jgi:hypothetical protein